MTDVGCHFCLLYHLKGVCNTHCGGRHSHIPIFQSEFGQISKWSDSFCSLDNEPPVREVESGNQSQAFTLSARKNRPRGYLVGRSTT